MAVIDQVLCERYAIYNGDSCEVLPSLPDGCIDLSVYSPPFAQPGGGALYHYSSSDRDLSNARSLDEFMRHYQFIVDQLFRLTKPGRMSAVHCADVPTGNTGCDHLFDLPGEIIRLHERCGFKFAARYAIWKEPLAVRNRTLAKNLAHKTIVDDSSHCSNAGADYLLLFRRKGDNASPIAHPHGLTEYAGEREIPKELHRYKGWKGKQTENRFSHWIWRQYASCFWDDIRLDNVLPYREARDSEDEKHVHPLQLDVIERCVQLWTNPGETVLTPFMGVGSEVYGAVKAGRRGVGVELKPSYWRQAVKNLEHAAKIAADSAEKQPGLFA
jgi:DNA modification methylase